MRIDILSTLGDADIVSSRHQERKKIDDWCKVPQKQNEAKQKIANYIDARSIDVVDNPAKNAHTLKSFTTDMCRIDQWLGLIEVSSGRSLRLGQEKSKLKVQLLTAYHTATRTHPAQTQALRAAYQALPWFPGKDRLWRKVTDQHLTLDDQPVGHAAPN